MGHGRGAAASPAVGTQSGPTRVAQASLAAAAAVAAVGQTTETVPAIPVPPRAPLRREKARALTREITGWHRRRLVGRAAAASWAAIVMTSIG